jgi:predicted DNA binding CopG/RHH family protein
MRDEYDFSDSVANPYVTKKQISIRIETKTIAYFKNIAKKVGVPYQTLINSYLTDCATKQMSPKLQWN